MIAIIDYDAGNLCSVQKAFTFLGEDAKITRDKREILCADHVVLPGVGAFGDAMKKLQSYELVDIIKEVIRKNTPFLGICLGLQLLFEQSKESKGISGLSVLSGDILRIPDKDELKIPHIGWNSIKIKQESLLFKGIPQNPYVYFVHSYYLRAKEQEDVAAVTEYGTLMHTAVEKGSLYACQFHPEKSGEVGLRILKNFAQI